MPTNPFVDGQGWADEWNAAIEAAKAEFDGTPESFDKALRKHCAPLIVADLNYELPIMKGMKARKKRPGMRTSVPPTEEPGE